MNYSKRQPNAGKWIYLQKAASNVKLLAPNIVFKGLFQVYVRLKEHANRWYLMFLSFEFSFRLGAWFLCNVMWIQFSPFGSPLGVRHIAKGEYRIVNYQNQRLLHMCVQMRMTCESTFIPLFIKWCATYDHWRNNSVDRHQRFPVSIQLRFIPRWNRQLFARIKLVVCRI